MTQHIPVEQLAAAPAATAKGGAAARGLSPFLVRAWAFENGIPCPQFGRIPAHILDQYEAAHGSNQ